jgi:hypothetical protein
MMCQSSSFSILHDNYLGQPETISNIYVYVIYMCVCCVCVCVCVRERGREFCSLVVSNHSQTQHCNFWAWSVVSKKWKQYKYNLCLLRYDQDFWKQKMWYFGKQLYVIFFLIFAKLFSPGPRVVSFLSVPM